MRRIAIITSETPNSLYAGSMQLLRVLRGYPADRLVVLGPEPPAGATRLDCDYRTLRFPIMRWRNTRFHRHAMSLVLLSKLVRPRPRQVGRVLGGFTADAVFTVMDNFSHYMTAYEYARDRRLPLITMTMDAPDSFEKIFPSLRPLQQRRIAEVYRYAERNLCVSRQMTAHISTTYGCKAETFYFGPPDGVEPRVPAESQRLRREGSLVLGYAGGLTYGYDRALRQVAAAVRDRPVVVRIYSRNKPAWPDLPNVEYAGCFEPEEVWVRFKEECDASLLVYDFDYNESHLYRTHFPTKLSEYAWLGMPMVMAGPDYATGIIWGLEHPEAALVDARSGLPELAEKLQSLAGDSRWRASMAAAAASFARSEFDPAAAKGYFQNALAYGRPPSGP